MKNNSVDKRKSKPLTRDDQTKYKGMQEYCRSRMEHLKKEREHIQNLNKECIAIIKQHRNKIDSLKISSTDPWITGLKDKAASPRLRLKVQMSEAVIKHQRHKIVRNKGLIKEVRSKTLTFWRQLEKYRNLVSAGIPWEKKDL